MKEKVKGIEGIPMLASEPGAARAEEVEEEEVEEGGAEGGAEGG